MRVRQCSNCKGFAEPPLSIFVFRVPDSFAGFAESHGVPLEREEIICEVCLETEREAWEELQKERIAGFMCTNCQKEMDPPGGFAVSTHDGTKLVRMCAKCRDIVESYRKRKPS
jgi:hypothetical protein